jgi:hypothetical protein
MARNLGLIMRALFGIGTPRSLQGEGGLAENLYLAPLHVLTALTRSWMPTLPFARQKSIDQLATAVAA